MEVDILLDALAVPSKGEVTLARGLGPMSKAAPRSSKPDHRLKLLPLNISQLVCFHTPPPDQIKINPFVKLGDQ